MNSIALSSWRPGVNGHITGLRLAVCAIVVAMILLLVFGPGHAFAQTPPPDFTTDDAGKLFGTEFGDPFSSIFLNEIFGPLFPSANGVEETTFSLVIGYFNVIMLAVGGLLFFYNITAGVLQSAHEGEVLGRRWNSMWAPIRVILAIGLLVPLPNYGGYNTVQAGVAFIVRGSTLLASQVWKIAATSIIDGSVPVAGGVAKFPDELVKNAWDMAACMAVANAQFAAAGSGNQVTLSAQNVQTSVWSSDTTPALVTQVSGQPSSFGICGSFRMPPTPAFLDQLEGNEKASIISAFNQAHTNALTPLIQTMTQLAGKVTQEAMQHTPNPTPITSDIVAAVNKANSDLSKGIGDVMQQMIGARTGKASATSLARERLKKYATGEDCNADTPDVSKENCYGQGWIGAGSWYMMVARLNNELLSVTSATPIQEGTQRYSVQMTGASLDRLINDPWFSSASNLNISAEETANILKALYDRFAGATAEMGTMGYKLDQSVVSDARPTESSIWDYLTISRGMVDAVAEFFRPSTWADDPMIGLTQLGNFLINVSAGISAALAAAGAIPVAGGGVNTLATIIGPILVTIAGGGAALAFILPMLPFLFWVLAVTGYFLLVVEAVVASSLWAVAHLKMDGEGISGDSARQGYLMVLALLMTPVLMIFGYIVGMTIFRVTSGIIDIGFYYALSGLDGGPLTWLVGMAALAVLIVVSYIIMIERSFSLVSEFPTRVLAWIGGRAEVTRGEEARMQGAAVAAGAGAGIASRGVGAFAGGTTRRIGTTIADRRNRGSNGGGGGDQKNTAITGPGDTGSASAKS